MESEMNFNMDSEMNDLDRIVSQESFEESSAAGFQGMLLKIPQLYQTESFQERSRSAAGFQERSRSTAGFQERSGSTAGFQERSQSTFEVQEKSRGSGYVQANFQMKSREFPQSRDANDFQLKPRKSTSILIPVPNSHGFDEVKFLRQVADRLFSEQFYAFLDNIEEQNEGKQPPIETLRKANEIFGTDNRDLYLRFEESVKSYQISYKLPWSSPITVQNDYMEFFPQVKICLFYKDWFLSFQEWLISGQEFSAANSPRSETSDFIRLAWSHEFIPQALSRLSKEQLDAIFANVVELRIGKQTGKETLLKMEENFGKANKDLFLSFQELLSTKIL